MSDDKNKNADDHGGIGPTVAAAVAGAVVGAGVAVAGTIAMQDPKNQEKVKDAMGVVKDHATEYLGSVQAQAEEAKKDLASKVEAEAKKAQK